MRWALSLPVLAVALAVTAQPERPADLVKAAVAAAGGAEVLGKYPAGALAGKGTMTFAGTETPFTCEQSFEVPGKFRTVVRCEVTGQKWELTQIVNGEKARQTINGRIVPLTEAGTKELRLAVLLNEVAQLTPLAADKKFALRPDKPPGVLLAQVRGFPELRLEFDRKAGHLVRVGYRSTDPDTAKEADTEMTFSDFKAVSGLTRPARCVVTRGGKTVLDLSVEKFTPLESIDARVFSTDE